MFDSKELVIKEYDTDLNEVSCTYLTRFQSDDRLNFISNTKTNNLRGVRYINQWTDSWTEIASLLLFSMSCTKIKIYDDFIVGEVNDMRRFIKKNDYKCLLDKIGDTNKYIATLNNSGFIEKRTGIVIKKWKCIYENTEITEEINSVYALCNRINEDHIEIDVPENYDDLRQKINEAVGISKLKFPLKCPCDISVKYYE